MIVSHLKKNPHAIRSIILVFLLLYLFIPVYLVKIRLFPFWFPLVLYAAGITAASYIYLEVSASIRHIRFLAQNMQEKINILRNENIREDKNRNGLREKISRYNHLKDIIEKINKNFDLDSTVDNLVSIAFSSIANSRGNCFLYLFDNQERRLTLYKTKKEDKRLIIKPKAGDMFDHWVLRHMNCLWVEDAKKDFRFDPEKREDSESRPLGSLISVPLAAGHSLVGILRLDNPLPNFYSLDDLRFLMAIADIGAVALENNELFEKTKELAIHDGLTGLFAKGYFFDRLKEECKRGLRQKKIFSLLMIDIDRFKLYNDRFGHPAGDIVLGAISRAIVDFLKEETALIGRFGGEEFCVILSERAKEEAVSLAERLRKNIEEQSIVLRGQETKVTVSIGVASFLQDARDEAELVIKADKAMYAAKQGGRNRVSQCS
ncbi:MAG: sensor domain-containing diguanylate cyclase [Candidatus Omnitrophica bacterium]|nr:sensor domain-containing diguanylate cyclase [Candidatus Omnitrophota bacterium]